ncbi:LysR family transcriptional regulator [Biostraticola tofi]|uniref:DNA-binding transcriptional LysR family regulator n=1 Tax=Biostraticola tofi TaxID=466109 RepID=A0A4V2W5G3_9GAMM|nr:LysR substrate-binding domain-containing protein [Biostraticola tofi]TCV99705.1 DNA-binding transcriptional LysR family regulator [Biostraticola tofi]
MRLRHIEIIHAIIQCGSITGAARSLNVSQPNISRVLSHAEQQLGFTLFERSPTGMLPTPQAQRLMPDIEKLFAHLQCIDRLALQLRDGQPQQLRVGSAHALGQSLMARVLMEYHQAQSQDIEVTLVTGHLDSLCDDLLQQRLDLALTFGQSLPPTLSGETLYRAAMVALAPMGMAVPSPVSLEWLCANNLLVMQTQDPLGQVVHDALSERVISVRGHLQIKTYSVIADMVFAGGGVGIVDTFTARRYAHQLQIIPIKANLPFEVVLLRAANTPLNSAALLMRQLIRARLGQWVGTTAA